MEDLSTMSADIIKLQILIIIDYFPIAFKESLPKTYNGIDSCAIFKQGFTFKINKDSFNFKWESLTAVPIILKLSMLHRCFYS